MLKAINIPRHFRIASVGWFSRIIAAISKVIAIPIVINYLDIKLYAIFAVILGLSSWFDLSNFGIAISLQNAISEARAKSQNVVAIISNGIILVGCFSLFILLVYNAVVAYPLQILLLRKLTDQAPWYMLMVAGSLFLLTTFFNTAYNIFFAEHRAHWAYIYQGLGAIFSVVGVILVRGFYVGDNRLLIVLLAWLFPPLFFTFIGFFQNFPRCNIFHYADIHVMKKILFRGFTFWGPSVGTMFVLMSDYIILSQTVGARGITIYSILSKAFNVVYYIYKALLQVVWPELAELFFQGKQYLANKKLLSNLFFGILFIIVCTGFLAMTRHLIIFVLAPHKHLILPYVTIFLFGCYMLTRMWSETFGMGLQCQNRLKIFWIYLPFQAFIGVIGMYGFSLWWGLNGIVFGLFLSYLLTASWILPLVYLRTMKRF